MAKQKIEDPRLVEARAALAAAQNTIAGLTKANREQLDRLVEQDLKIGRMGTSLEAARAELQTLKSPSAASAEVTLTAPVAVSS